MDSRTTRSAIRNRHRLQQRRVDDAEDGCVRADAQGEDKDDDSGESWRPEERAEGVEDIRHV